MPNVSVLEQIHCVQALLLMQEHREHPHALTVWERCVLEAILETLARLYVEGRVATLTLECVA
jgi:hypothetical protein